MNGIRRLWKGLMIKMTEKWNEYFEATKENPPSQTAMNALAQFGETCGSVIDLGCGAGTDAIFFLKNNWKVQAIDAHTDFIMTKRKEMPSELQNRLEICQMGFEQLHIEQPVECMIANFSIPFCHPQKFDSMWSEIVKGLKPNGVFSGVFFGNHDDWATNNFENRTFHTYEQVQDLLSRFTIISFKEEQWDGTCCGEDGQPIPKHWHIFRVVARKK